MKFWARLGLRQRDDLSAQEAITRAYRSVFQGNADRTQQQMVLADLAARCLWHTASGEGTSPEVLAYREGKRAAFAEIYSHLSLSPEDMDALSNAARHERARMELQANASHQFDTSVG